MAQQPAPGRMASQVEEEDAFVRSGMVAIAVEHAKYLRTDIDSKRCIAVPTETYETLLRATFCYEGSQLSLAGKDGSIESAIPLRFDPAKKVLFASDPHDGRMLVPLDLICRHLDQQKQQGLPFGAVSSLGTKFVRQIEGANHPAEEPELFQYDEHGKYIGARINGQFVPAQQLTQTGLCLVCRSTATKRCIGCKHAQYCSVECQKLDWTHHRSICGRLQPTTPGENMGDFVVASRSDANLAEIQTLTSKLQAVQQYLVAQAQLN
jgi:hypothetical protein